MSRHNRHIADLIKLAEDVSPVNNARVAASIVINNNTVSYGTCSYKSHPFQKKYSKNSEAIYLHAEVDAIKNALKRIRNTELLKSATIYVARSKKVDGEACWGLAKPCKGCQRAIAAFDIRNVFYTTDEQGVYECL